MRRRLLSVSVCLLVGAIATVAVAWLSTRWMTPADAMRPLGVGHRGWVRSGGGFSEGTDDRGHTGWMLLEYERSGVRRFVSSWYDPDVPWSLNGPWPRDPAEPLVPTWAPFLVPTSHAPEHKHHTCIAEARGWPLLALSGGFMVSDRRPDKLHCYAAIVPDPDEVARADDWNRATILPLRPMPLGFLADTLSYGSAAWALALVPGFVRRRSRRRAGRCEGCGHLLAHLEICPECGRHHARHRTLAGAHA